MTELGKKQSRERKVNSTQPYTTINNQFFFDFTILDLVFLDASSTEELEQRFSDTLILLRLGSGDGELFTLPALLTLGVVEVDETVGLSCCKTALRYPVSNFPSKAALRTQLPFMKFQMENFLSANRSAPRPKRRKTRLIDLGSR